ncbi:MAG: hypothetical protein Q8L34_04685 [Candidatus Woesearchaeota archaeon]|nr:hypothetical protein [Candidatus Woesearchaeota archaeon]
MKKRKATLLTTVFSHARSLLLFLAVLLGLFVLLYSTLVAERTPEVNSATDLTLAKQTLQSQLQNLEHNVGELRALVT